MASSYESITKPFILFLLLLISTSSHSKSHTCLTEQQNALLQFKNSVKSLVTYRALCPFLPAYEERGIEFWANDTDCCIWGGVTCDDKTGDVISLDISCSGLTGNIDQNNSLFLLQNLRSLNLAYNALDGSVNSFTQLSNLFHLDLSFNRFYDTIHLEISYSTRKGTINNSSLFPLQNLRSLNLSQNGLSGSLNFLSQLSSLMHLDLSFNKFSGIIPHEIARLSQLSSLKLSGNNLTLEKSLVESLIPNLTRIQELNLDDVRMDGVSPSSLLNLSTTLISLTLSNCGLSGRFPNYIFHLPNLRILDVSQNLGFTGTLPKLNWSGPLISFDLSSTDFSESIPSSICSLSSLQVLDISGNRFSGFIPQCLGNLINLQRLDMSLNQLTGPLPRSLNNCTQMKHMNVGSNMLNDTSPYWLDRLSGLEVVDLGRNRFYGPIGRLFTEPMLYTLILSHNSISGHLPDFDDNLSLHILDLSNNSLEGPIPKLPQVSTLLFLSNNKFTGEIPLSICKLDPIVLDLSSNNLTGTIPPCLLNKTGTSGSVINLGMNQLEGAIPDNFVEDNSLRALDLKKNQLTGPLPRSMVNCKELLLLDLSNNNIEDSFPNWLDTLPDLQVLILKSNKLNGKLKTSTDHPFPKLRLFHISNNNLIGLLPIEYISQLGAMKDANIFMEGLQYMDVVEAYGNIKAYFLAINLTMKGSEIEFPKISMALSAIDFSKKHFQGKVPEVIGELVALKGLNLSHNNLTGSIPLSIQNLTSLEWLDLSSNKLDGLIPTGLTNLTGLSTLNLSYNELRGMIPTGQQFDTFSMESFVGNTGLCGQQINKTCGEHIPKQPQLPLPPYEEDDFSAFDWKIILMGSGSGLVIGISIGYMVFELRRPKWFVLLVEEKLLKKIARSSTWRI